MFKNKKLNLIIVLTLMLSLCMSAFAVSFGATAEEKRKEAKEAAKKAAAATENFEEAEKRLDALQAEIEQTKQKIEDTKVKIQKKKKEIKRQEADLDSRLTAMYKTGTVGYVDVILSSMSVEDLMTNIGMVQKILESDQKLLKKLEKQHKKLKQLEDSLEDQEIMLEAKEDETKELVKKYKAEADKYKAMEDQLLAEASQLAAEAAQHAGNAEELIAANGGNLDTSAYTWPTKLNYIITSKYGWRICPFHGKEFHDGLDICLSSGTFGSPVYAIADCMVTRASWYGGYGNCVTIECGNGYGALYGHLSSIAVSYGSYVPRGTVLGYIGSTGNSTGPHLHFMVFKNGATISPWSIY